MSDLCTVALKDGSLCGRPVRGRSMCGSHYWRWLKHGDPHGGRASQGEVRRYFHENLRTPADGCKMWPFSPNSKGYPSLEIDGKRVSVHVAACEAFNGPRPDGMQAAHICGNKRCFNGAHLRWTTPRDNTHDKYAHGTMLRGENAVTAVLTEDQAREIVARLATGERHRSIAADYPVTRWAVAAISRGKNWKHLTEELRARRVAAGGTEAQP